MRAGRLLLKKVATIGLVAVLTAVIGGGMSINKSGLNQNEAPQPIEPIERPIIEPFQPFEPKELTSPETLDDLFAAIAKQVPAFGGMFIDEQDNLAIYLTDLSPSVVIAVEAAIRDVFGADEHLLQRPMRMLQGQYGFLQLKDWYDRMAPEVLALPGVVLTDIDEAKNRLAIGIETLGMQSQAESLLARLSIPLEAVNIEETKPVEFELRNHRRPLVGGLQIQINNFIGSFCTLGVIATRGGVQGFVTNSHCTSIRGGVEGTVYHQPSPRLIITNQNRVGLEVADPTYFTGSPCPSGRRCRYSDSAFVRVPHPSGPSVTVSKGFIARPALGSFTWNGTDRFRITSELLTGNPIVGTAVTKVGRTTGRTSGTVTRACVSINVLNTNITLLCQNEASYSSSPGDSGSPVFQITNSPSTNDVRIIGIHWGSGGAFSSTGTVGVQRSTELGFIYMCAPGFSC